MLIKHENTNKGITLIALIITIIVLLILAGVTLATLTGDSGILSNAEKAKENTNMANAKEYEIEDAGDCFMENGFIIGPYGEFG